MHLTSFTTAFTALTFSLLLAVTPSFSQYTTLSRRQNTNSTLKVLPPTTRYSEQTFTGTHHSAMLRTSQNGFSLSGNQFHNITVQLEAGVRLLYGHTFLIGNEIRICHTSCAILDGGRLEDMLLQVSDFLEKYQSEVVTFMWTNPDGNTPLSMIDQAYNQAGLSQISYIPPHAEMDLSDWPTIAEMVVADRRVVSFMDTATDRDQVPYILPLWTFVRETPAMVTDKTKFTCGTGSDQSLPGEKLAMVNHLLYEDRLRSGRRFPDVARVGEVNAANGSPGALLNHLDLCMSEWSRRPNFALVDFFDRGDVFLAQDVINGLKPHPSGGLSSSTSLESGKDTSEQKKESKFITLDELQRERTREKEKENFEKEIDAGRRKFGISEEQVEKGEGLQKVFTFTRTVPSVVAETEGVVNAGAPDPNAGERVRVSGGWSGIVVVVSAVVGVGMVW